MPYCADIISALSVLKLQGPEDPVQDEAEER